MKNGAAGLLSPAEGAIRCQVPAATQGGHSEHSVAKLQARWDIKPYLPNRVSGLLRSLSEPRPVKGRKTQQTS
ncbi:hypothetical protein NDU88_001185 [Pleurodeles waltl]|uniref:Uncharacterized protein n=1 Tax=Pleurodeles waltl TaxID=8319 RepID=A0AAV7UTJ6_PLEWA|nr:hypothetical protein NDU88_001185 [Pleurodeles waltl]